MLLTIITNAWILKDGEEGRGKERVGKEKKGKENRSYIFDFVKEIWSGFILRVSKVCCIFFYLMGFSHSPANLTLRMEILDENNHYSSEIIINSNNSFLFI